MKKMKRFVSLLVAVATLAASCVFALSVQAEEVSAVEVTEADMLIVEKLEAFGAITNEYEDIGAFVTRRQMVDIIINYLRMPKSSNDVKTSPFADVSVTDSSVGNITALYNAGIITGDENLKFHPDANLTYDEAIVFVVNAVGHKLFAAREGGFPTGYHRIAIKHDMLDGLKFKSGKELIPLCDVYKLLESALDVGAVVPEVFSDGSVDYKVSLTETYLSDMYNIVEYKGLVTGTEDTRLDNPNSNLTDEQVEINGVVYDTPGYVYATSLGRAVYYYIRKTAEGDYDVAYVEENQNMNKTFQISSEDLIPGKTTTNRIYYYDENDKERHINLSNNVDVIYNGKCYSGYGKIQNVLPEFGYIVALDNTGDEVSEVLFVYEYNDIVIGSVDTYDETITAMISGEEFVLDSQEDKINIRLMPDNKKLSLSTLQQWDVASILESKSDPKMYTIYVSRETISGTVEEINSELGYLINGEYYEPAPGTNFGDEIVAGMSAVFYLDFNGKIVCTDRSKAVNENENYAVVTGIDYNVKSATSEVMVQLYTHEGSFLEIPLKSNVTIDGKRYNATGSDMEDVLNILSNGVTNASGEYFVNSAYVVRYVISDGKLSYLDTGKTGVNGKLRLFANAPVSSQTEQTSFLARSGGVMQVVSKEPNAETGALVKTTRYASYVPNQVYVFTVPNDGELDQTEEYSVSRNIQVSKYYRGYSAESSHTKYVSGFMMYDLGENDTNTVDVIMTKGGGTSTQISETSTMYAVTKVTNAVDAEGDAASKLYLNANSDVVTADKIEEISGLITAKDVDAEKLGDIIKPGMVICYGTDEKGLVDRIQVLAIYDAENKTISVGGMSGSSNLVNLQDGKGRTAGTVLYNDAEKKIVNILPADNAATNALITSGAASVTVYRENGSKATATNGSIASIAEGDFVIVRLESYFNAREVIVFKK